jgi:exonuclease VII small subunit
MTTTPRSFGEQLVAAVREWKRARALADEARLETDRAEKLYEQALAVAGAAHNALDALIRDGEGV